MASRIYGEMEWNLGLGGSSATCMGYVWPIVFKVILSHSVYLSQWWSQCNSDWNGLKFGTLEILVVRIWGIVELVVFKSFWDHSVHLSQTLCQVTALCSVVLLSYVVKESARPMDLLFYVLGCAGSLAAHVSFKYNITMITHQWLHTREYTQHCPRL